MFFARLIKYYVCKDNKPDPEVILHFGAALQYIILDMLQWLYHVDYNFKKKLENSS